jgi:ethanolamine utilization protein EutP
MVNRETIGIVTGIDKPDANVERVTRWLKLAGCKKIFPVSSFTGEGIKELSEFLRDDSDLKRVKKDEIKEKPVVQTNQEKLDVWLL